MGGSARKDLRRSKAASDAALKEGYTGANANLNQAYDLYTPYAESGQQGSSLYNQAIGIGTPEQRTAAQGIYLNDPMQQAQLGQSSNALLRNLNARGAGPGVQALGASRVSAENYGNWLNRLQGVGQQGLAATGAQAGVRGSQAELNYGYGATRAGQETSFGNAMGASRNILTNNLLNAAGTAAKFFGGK